MELETARLRLIPFSPQHLLALIEGTGQFEQRFGLRAADGLREFFVSADVSPAWLAQLRASSSADPWTHGFAVVHRESNTVIGSVGFKGPPDAAGVAEIAYGIVPGFQAQGYATEAAAASVAFAFADGRVRIVRAHTLPTANASTRVLWKCGFTRRGEVEDPDDGLVWRWETSEVARVNVGIVKQTQTGPTSPVRDDPTSQGGVTICFAGNTTEPCLIILREKGYDLTTWASDVDQPLNWDAEKEGNRFSATSAAELLGLITMWEHRGENWQHRPGDPNPPLLASLIGLHVDDDRADA